MTNQTYSLYAGTSLSNGGRFPYTEYVYETKTAVWSIRIYDHMAVFTRNCKAVTREPQHTKILSYFKLEII